MNYKHAEYVMTIVEQGGITAAARVLHISQPSLSASVKRIEDKIGYPLFDRNTKPVRLTECGEHYIAAVEKIMVDSSRMWFILPDEGVGMDELLADGEYRKFVRITMQPNVSWNQSRNVTVNLRLPKFDVSSGMDLAGTLRTMGVTDCFDPERSDFTPLSGETLWVGRVQHDARLTVDEQGVRAAAYTAASLKAEAEPPEEEVDFTLDRPFIFLLVSADDVPLYTGVVNQPQ